MADLVVYLSEFLVCESEGCFQAVNICHRDYFRDSHFDAVGGKRATHKSTPFDESLQFANLRAIAKLHDRIADNLTRATRGFPVALDTLTQTALYSSPLFLEVFNNSAQAIGEYLYLRAIQQGQQLPVVPAFSPELCATLLVSQERRVGKAYRQACRESPEWEQLNAEFNLASGINSGQLQAFIAREAAYFTGYCQSLGQQGREFSIGDYLSLRAGSTAYENDPYYFGSEFTDFLSVKYGRHPQRERLFEVGEYYLHFWEYFHAAITKNVAAYFEEELAFYRDYQAAAAAASLRESFLGFRMWRLNHRASATKPSLRNPFFLDSFIYSLIEDLIHKRLYYPEEKAEPDFRAWARFLKDYVKLVRDHGQQFNFAQYRDYHDFRARNEKFEAGLAANKDIIYDRSYFLEYAHAEFLEGNRLAGKKYRKHHDARRLEEEQKAASFRQTADALRSALQAQEKENFYEVVFINFINAIQEDQAVPTEEAYQAYRAQVLASIDEELLQEEEANYREAVAEQQGQRKEGQEKKEAKEEIVKEEITAIEERIAEIIVDQEGSEESEASEEVVCPCCKGQPYDCREKECMVMGCCTACMFD